MATLIVAVILICLIGAAGTYLYKAKKRGVHCVGCPSGGVCSGHCGGGAGCSGQSRKE